MAPARGRVEQGGRIPPSIGAAAARNAFPLPEGTQGTERRFLSRSAVSPRPRAGCRWRFAAVRHSGKCAKSSPTHRCRVKASSTCSKRPPACRGFDSCRGAPRMVATQPLPILPRGLVPPRAREAGSLTVALMGPSSCNLRIHPVSSARMSRARSVPPAAPFLPARRNHEVVSAGIRDLELHRPSQLRRPRARPGLGREET